MSTADLILALAGIPPAAASVYLAVLAALARASDAPTVQSDSLNVKFDVIVPAHNEELGIASTVQSLLAVDYPRSRFRVLVVADNCSDHTAEKAAAAGALVTERVNANLRGKGYALSYMFDRCLRDDFADAFVVVDADTVVSPNLLRTFAARFAAGAEVLQAEYGVRNPLSSWRTRLMTIALAAFHGVRSLARERLRVSCGLRGNGMGFSKDVLRQVPPDAFSIVEDLEYGLQLGRAGVRIEYVGEARVLGQMVDSEHAARSQRHRWESGRRTILRQQGWQLLRQAVQRRSLLLGDLLVDLLVPPLAELAAVNAIGFVLAILLTSIYSAAVLIWTIAVASVVIYVARGWALSGMGARGLLDLLWAPIYVCWKLALRFVRKGGRPKEWVRTTREVRM